MTDGESTYSLGAETYWREDWVTIANEDYRLRSFSWFPWVLTIAVLLFAFSTMISWSYYGLKAWTFLFGENKITDATYKLLFLFFVVVGSSMQLGAVIDFSDAMIFAMAFPNLLGCYFLLPVVKKELNEYWADYKSGKLRKTRIS